MVHEKYSGKIKNYIDGIARDLENVTANPGHDLVKDSILEQSRRLADHATHDQKFLMELFDEFLSMLEKRHTIVDFREHDCWKCVPREQVMDEFKTYLTWGLDAVDHFDDKDAFPVPYLTDEQNNILQIILMAKCDERQRQGCDHLTDSDLMDLMEECRNAEIPIKRCDLESICNMDDLYSGIDVVEIVGITGATLLSVEEAEELDREILKAGENWWLGSRGFSDLRAACVDGDDGYVYDGGIDVSRSFGVRPALKLSNLESSSQKIGDTLSFGDHSFTIISDRYALCDDIIGECVFRKDWRAINANVYEESDVKKFVDDWFAKAKEKENKTQEESEEELDKE